MDDKQKPIVTDVDSQQSIEEPLTDVCSVKIEEIVESNDQDVAGPSTAIPVVETLTLPGAVEILPETVKNPLPGTVQATPKTAQMAGLSKSEHNLRHIITAEDVARALNSKFANLKPTKLNFKGIEIPLIHRKTLSPIELMEKPCSPLHPIDQNVHVVLSSVHANVPNSSLVTSNVQTEVPTVKTNEVIVTKTNAVPKISRPGSDTKKKTSANPSERSDFGLTTRDSLSSIGSNVCRICMTRGRERLISPCNCKGSLANVHLTCLERWLNQVGRNHCELCGFSYPAIRTPRYTVLQALRLWFGNPRNRSHLQSDLITFMLLSTVTAGFIALCKIDTYKLGNLYCPLFGLFQSDCLIFWLLSTVTAGLLAVCIIGTEYFVIEGGKFGKHGAMGGTRIDEGISHRITETAMDFFMAIVLCGYSVTVYLLWKDHYVMWNRWRRANVNVRLLLTPDSNPVPFVPRNCRYNQV